GQRLARRHRSPQPPGSTLSAERPVGGTPDPAGAGPRARPGRRPDRGRGRAAEVRMSHPLAPVMAAVPHRHPMLLLDRLTEVVPGRSGSAIKAISANEVQFQGEGLPRTLIVDALGQLAIVVLAPPAPDGSPPAVYYLAEIAGMELGRPPAPGDLLRMEATVQKS